MAAPTQDVYFAEDFDVTVLKVPQLRSILVEHSVAVPGKALKPDLIKLFETEVLPKRDALLIRAGKIKPSAKGIVAVSLNGDETPVEPPKRARGRPRKTAQTPASEEGLAEPAPKRSRQNTRASRTPALGDDDAASTSASTSAPRSARVSAASALPSVQAMSEEEETVEVPAVPAKRGRGRPSKASKVQAQVQVEDGDEAGIEDEADKVSAVKAPRKSRPRQTRQSSSPAPAEPPTLATSSRPASSSINTDLRTPMPEAPKSILKKEPSIHFQPDSSLSPLPAKSTSTPSKRKSKTSTQRRRGTSDGEESGFSDANPFQSGNESAQAEVRRRRKSTMGVTAKREPSEEPKHKTPRRSEPAPFSFTPGRASAQPQAQPTLRKMRPSQEDLKSPPMPVRKQMLQERDRENEEAEAYNRVIGDRLAGMSGTSHDDAAGGDEEEEEEQEEIEEPRGTGAETPQVVVTAHSMQAAPPSESNTLALVPRPSAGAIDIKKASTLLPLSAILLPLLLWLSNWKSASSSIGYCDTSSSTNAIAQARLARRAEAASCNALRAEQTIAGVPADQLVTCDYSALPLIPFLPLPSACAPCPPHAECANGRIVSCQPEYLLADSPLAFLEPILGGLPGVGPSAFPPSCRPDTAKKRYIGEMAREVEGFLAKARGGVECARKHKEGKEGERGEGRVFGLREEDLRGVFEPRRDPKVSQEQFHEVWEAALKDLIEHEDLVETIDVDGIAWYAAKRSEMTLACAAKTQLFKSVDEWKSQLAAAILALQSRLKTRRSEKFRAEELAQVVLKRLQDQSRLHLHDASTTPAAYLAPEQLRDLVLPPAGSLASRKRTWERVERLVAKNANVASREREVGGEMWSTWEWTGPVGRALAGEEYGYGYQEQDGEDGGIAGVMQQRSPARIKF